MIVVVVILILIGLVMWQATPDTERQMHAWRETRRARRARRDAVQARWMRRYHPPR